MRQVLFSIITPVYKVEKYLDECVKSVLNQTFTEFELILIDDGSTDNCPAMCDNYVENDARVKVIHKKNEGVSIARRIGVETAVGDYLIFVDSDDYLFPDALHKIKNAIAEYTPDIVAYSLLDPIRRKSYIRSEKGYFSKEDIEYQIFPKLLESKTGVYFEPALYLHAIKKDLYLRNAVGNEKIVIGEDLACTKA